MKFPRQVFLLVATFALLASACSSDGASVSTNSESAAPASASQESAERSESEPDAPVGQDDQPADPDQSADLDQVDPSQDFDGSGSRDWCETFRAFEADEPEADVDDRPSSGDPLQVEAYYQDQLEEIEEVQRVAPPELAQDVAILLETNVLLIDALEAAGWDFANVDGTALDAGIEGYEQALTNLEDYNFQVCGIER